MDDSGAILCQISWLKDTLDQVNEEIEANIQITREIESEIVKCTEIETALAVNECELTKSLYVSQFEIDGLLSVTRNSNISVRFLEEEIFSLRNKRDDMLKVINEKRQRFLMLCLEFQKDIANDELVTLMSEKGILENEVYLLDRKNNALKNSILAFAEDILVDLHDSNSALQAEIQSEDLENESVLKDIEVLQNMLHSTIVADNGRQ
ncbi:hypothetical protein CFOL_v3_02340 [Cephalotus follicularis]|uniref:Uncharacterized protein n=1 Tax=Cephalotus follicularis TaxID=3775 RepID=A0A1Q3AST0_CEPFO|nr:hypothetical protein CFOL_v3_02340 [Cephalotus follicularis]